jgi:hypothetical protein
VTPACILYRDGLCFRENERRHTKPEALVSYAEAVSAAMPRRSLAIGRCLRSSVAPTCTDSVSPGLGAVSATGPNEPKQTPASIVSGYSRQLNVLPNVAILARPLPENSRVLGVLVSEDPACRCQHATSTIAWSQA